MIYAFTAFIYLMGWVATGSHYAASEKLYHRKLRLLIWLVLFFIWTPLIMLSCWDGLKLVIRRCQE